MFPVYVISLQGESARRGYMRTHLCDREFDFEFFDAIDARQMKATDHPNYNGTRRRAAYGRDLEPGELGCLLSHRGVYKKIVEEGHKYVLLLEDDAQLAPDTKTVLEDLIAKQTDFDIIRLLGSAKTNRSKHRKLLPLTNDHWLVRMRTQHSGAHATLISQRGAQKLLEATRCFAFPIDIIISRVWAHNLESYSILPGLAVQNLDFNSTIGDVRHDRNFGMSATEKFKFRITRGAFKLSEAARKAWAYWSRTPKDLAMRKII